MPNTVLLNNVDHKDLRVITERGAQYGDNVSFALTFPSEFRALQSHYPIVFRKNGDGSSFEAIALLGFVEGENLFLEQNRWDATYIPLTVDRLPFLIGRDGEELMIHVDLDHPRVHKGGEAGEPVFLQYGGNTEYLEGVSQKLKDIHEGLQRNGAFMAALLSLELLEPFVLDIQLNDGSQNRLAGFYTINEDRLAGLDGATLERLNANGYLQAIYMVVASLNNFRSLIDRKNRRNAIDL
ncbi:peptidase [Massilia arenosa]|uniref:Peptidase n=1 Tax=Zemynaea arenosa TaxID=2561931 RepID=A0A4Y9SCS9_9BURK|nr:SapC family protein [Massilia arenosa]TFW20369.1 peptidase [Massilia arenosa]